MIRNSFLLVSLCLRTISSCLGNFHLIHTSITRRRCQCRWRGCESGLVQLLVESHSRTLGPTGLCQTIHYEHVPYVYVYVSLCLYLCVYVWAKCALWSEFLFFLVSSLRFSDGKNCVEIYFAAFPSVLAGFTHLLGF